MSHVLITGGAGFVGSNLASKLLLNGHKVIAIDNLITSDGSNIKKLKNNPNFRFIKHDITLPLPKVVTDQLLTPIKSGSNVNSIYHLACPTGVPNLKRLAEEMLLTCSIGTLNILELAKKTKSKLIFTSSSEVYGDPEVFPQKEDYTGNVNPIGTRSPYEEGKRFAESLIKSYVNKYSVDAKIVRLFNVYGPGSASSETRVIPVFLRHAIKGLPIPVAGDGSQTRTFCHVDDLIEALFLIAEKGEKGEVYNAGSDVEFSILELAKLVIQATGSKSKIKFVPRPKHDHRGRRPDLTKIKNLGWQQTIGIYEGLKLTINK